VKTFTAAAVIEIRKRRHNFLRLKVGFLMCLEGELTTSHGPSRESSARRGRHPGIWPARGGAAAEIPRKLNIYEPRRPKTVVVNSESPRPVSANDTGQLLWLDEFYVTWQPGRDGQLADTLRTELDQVGRRRSMPSSLLLRYSPWWLSPPV
jgi:hypothetical protein